MGAGDKVKEAVAESLEKTRATVEDSAKTAAKIASETVHKTKEKVKRSLSDEGRQESDHSELWACIDIHVFVKNGYWNFG